jgi:N-acetylglucosamine kinase-like BadF-type ATPase
MLQVGEQGGFTSDNGGGGYLGVKAVSCVYDYLFLGGPYTIIADTLFEKFKIPTKYDFMDVITEKLNEGKNDTGELCRLVFKAANIGDAVALCLLDDMGIEMAKRVNGIINDLRFYGVDELDVILAGSVNVKGENPAAINRLRQDVAAKNKGRKIKFEVLQKAPVLGAVVWALEENMRTGDSFYKKVMEQP